MKMIHLEEQQTLLLQLPSVSLSFTVTDEEARFEVTCSLPSNRRTKILASVKTYRSKAKSQPMSSLCFVWGPAPAMLQAYIWSELSAQSSLLVVLGVFMRHQRWDLCQQCPARRAPCPLFHYYSTKETSLYKDGIGKY